MSLQFRDWITHTDPTWFGYTRSEYYEQVWQEGDPHWEELEPDEDHDGWAEQESSESQNS